MPSQRVGIDIQANVTGSAAVQQLIQQLQQLNGLISPVAGKNWIGPGGVQGMINTAGQMPPPVSQALGGGITVNINVANADLSPASISKLKTELQSTVRSWAQTDTGF